MPRPKRLSCALTVAGSDSGGGAGIQADLKTMASLGVHGTSAITCITAQNPKNVRAIQACTPGIVRQQMEAVLEELPPAAVKTGMLFSTSIIQTVARTLSFKNAPPLVVDPVMVSTSGARLLRPGAIKALCGKLLPMAALITPNLDETELLLNRKLASMEALQAAARDLHDRFGCAVLVKGGHLRTSRYAVDVFFDGTEERLLSAPFVRHVSTHGTGCTYSAAITAFLARGLSLPESVQRGKEYITMAIRQSVATDRHTVLNSFWERRTSAR